MKSKLKPVNVKYLYWDNQTFQMEDTLAEVLYSLKADKEQDLYDWVEDDTWMTLPRNNFNLTRLKLDASGHPLFIQFTERNTRA